MQPKCLLTFDQSDYILLMNCAVTPSGNLELVDFDVDQIE